MGYEPVYTVYVSEVAHKPAVLESHSLLTGAIEAANNKGLKSYVVRRSYMAGKREYLTGLVVYSKRG
jgi:hypothetical protein